MHTIVGLTYLTLDLFGNMEEFYYQLILSAAVTIVGFVWFVFPVYAPRKDEEENSKAIKRAKRGGKILFVLGLLFLIFDFIVFTS